MKFNGPVRSCFAFFFFLISIYASGCGGGGGSSDDDDASVIPDDDDSAVADDAADDTAEDLTLTITYHRIPSAAASANPVTGMEAPEEYNVAAFTRYRMTDHGETIPVSAVLIEEGGFMGGANNFHYMAQELVKATQGRVEVWAVDRRPNVLEDLTGVEAAEREGDPNIVYDYYLDGATVDGQSFAGFIPDRDLDYLSEWGMATAVNDLAAMIDLVPEENRKANVFLAGHSLGGLLIENFAAWDFDGDAETTEDAGYNRIAGLVLLDGSVRNFSEMTWLWRIGDFFTSTGNLGYEAAVGFVRALGPRYFALPIMQRIMAQIEALGMAADRDPDGASDAYDRSSDLRIGLALMYAGTGRIEASNAAILGIVLDNDFQWISAMDSSFGNMTGTTRQRRPPIAVFETDTTKPYLVPSGSGPFGWTNSSDIAPPAADEVTDMHTLANATYVGQTNWIEWYFTTRFVLDVLFSNDLDIRPNATDARWREGLRSIHVAECDMPVIAFGAEYGFMGTAESFDFYRAKLPPVRDSGGAARTEAGFDVNILAGYSHHDPMLAGTDSTPNAMFEPLLDWIDEWSEDGTFYVPEIEPYP